MLCNSADPRLHVSFICSIASRSRCLLTCGVSGPVCLQIEGLQAQESQVRALEQAKGPVSGLLQQLGSGSPEEIQAALEELLTTAAASR